MNKPSCFANQILVLYNRYQRIYHNAAKLQASRGQESENKRKAGAVKILLKITPVAFSITGL